MSTTPTTMEEMRRPLPARVERIGWTLLACGVAVWVAGYAVDPVRAGFNNILAFLFLTSIAVGGLFFVALEYIAGAVWSVPVRRINEFLAGLLPVVPLLAIPLLLNLHGLYHWTHEEAVAGDAVLAAKTPYLNVTFFVIRFVAVFVVWNLFCVVFVRNSVRQDTTRDARLTTHNIRLAAVFLPVLAITITLTAIDWAMSLEPHWYSTIFGVYYFTGTALAGVSAATLCVVLLMEKGYLNVLRRDHLYSLGALMFAFVNFWAYIAFSQFMLIWYANLPEETFWFMQRWKGGWIAVSVLLIIVHFLVPYFALLAQDAKMDPRRLKVMAVWILFAHLLDLYWLVMPTYSASVPLGWMELGFPVLAIGLCLVVVSRKSRRYNLIPIGDPKLERGLNFRL